MIFVVVGTQYFDGSNCSSTFQRMPMTVSNEIKAESEPEAIEIFKSIDSDKRWPGDDLHVLDVYGPYPSKVEKS